MKNLTKAGLLSALAVVAVVLVPSCKKNAKIDNIEKQPTQNPGKQKTESLNYHLVAYWPLDGSGADLSGNGHTATVNGSVSSTSDRFGNAGRAMHFNNSSGASYLSVPDATDLQLWSGDFTISAWVRLDNYNTGAMSQIISKHNSSPYTGWGAAISGDTWGTAGFSQGFSLFGSGASGTFLDESTHFIGTGSTWHMLSYVYHVSSNTVDMYIDGSLDFSSHPSSHGFSTASVTIGYNTALSAYGFTGDMDEIRIYNGALLAANIADLYNAPNAGGLLAYWSFDSNANDYSGNSYNGTATSTTTVVDRNSNNAAYGFNGTSSFVSVADNTALRLNNTDFTLNAWVKVPSIGTAVQILAKRSSTPAGYGWSLTTSGTTFFGAGGTTKMSFGGTALTANVWHMVTVTYQKTSATVGTVTHYLDGAATGTPVPNFPTPDASVSNILVIGRDNLGPNYYFSGGIDDVRIYNKLLSSTDITNLYNTHY